MLKYFLTLTTSFSLLNFSLAQLVLPKPLVADKIINVFEPSRLQDAKVSASSYIGERMEINIEKRLLTLDLASILEPYIHRPGKQTWIGEHVGKFLHAAANVYEANGNMQLKNKMDSVAKVLIASQIPDGYLGTYIEKDRWKDWDVWAHKYNLIGLLSYYKVTGNMPALEACKRIGNLLIQTFGEGKKDIIQSSWHVGMASTSVLEPIVMLYRYTADKRYLDFCRYIVSSWDHPDGPQILKSLLAHGNVYKTANGKAYEMLSNLVGLIDLYRITGEANYFTACQNAWTDIITNRLYPIGTASWGEHFREDSVLRPDGEVHGDKYNGPGEGCVTVTWLQLNWHLLQLTGKAAFAHEIERIIYNSLIGAQSPQNGTVCYFVPLDGRKRFAEVNHGILPDISCCSSSIPRGLALIPQFINGTMNGMPALLQYIHGTYRFSIPGKKKLQWVKMEVKSEFPKNGVVTIKLNPESKGVFDLMLRVPAWSANFKARVNNEEFRGEAGKLLTIKRLWNPGDEITVLMDMDLKLIPDPNKNSTQVYIQRGPQILAVDDQLDVKSNLPDYWVGNQFYVTNATTGKSSITLRLVPFADAGQTGGNYQVLFPRFEKLKEAN